MNDDTDQFTDHPPIGEPPAKSKGIHVPTVLAAGGVAAIVSAIIATIAVVGVLAGNSDEALPPVVNIAASPEGFEVLEGVEAPAAGSNDPSTTPTTPPADGEAGAALAPATAEPEAAPEPATPAPAAPVAPATQAPEQTAAPEPAAPQTQNQSTSLPANFTVTTDDPSVQDLQNIVTFLVATPASDGAKAANVEGGQAAVVVPKTVYSLGLFRAPLGWHKVSGPLQRDGDRITAQLTSGSVGRPTIALPIVFKKIDGNWRLSAESLCRGVQTVGLNIYCNA